MYCGSARGSSVKRPAPSLRNSELPGHRLHDTSTSRSASLSTSASSRSHEKRIVIVRQPRRRRVREPAGAVVEPQTGQAAVVGHVVAGTPVGEHEVEVAVAIHVAGFEIADAQRHLRQVRARDFCEAAFSRSQEQPALRLVGRADDDVGEAVAVQIARLDDARQIGCGTEHLFGDFRKARARARR